jgi:protein AaeX
MRFTEIDVYGVYVAPISILLVAAWLVTIGLRKLVSHCGLWNHVWHPALFVGATYTIVLSLMVLAR